MVLSIWGDYDAMQYNGDRPITFRGDDFIGRRDSAQHIMSRRPSNAQPQHTPLVMPSKPEVSAGLDIVRALPNARYRLPAQAGEGTSAHFCLQFVCPEAMGGGGGP